MDYEALLTKLIANGWQRIERDDRLLDIFPAEDREKGIELWETHRDDETLLLRVRLPYQEKNLKLYTLATSQLSYLLQHNTASQLGNFAESATGTAAIDQL